MLSNFFALSPAEARANTPYISFQMCVGTSVKVDVQCFKTFDDNAFVIHLYSSFAVNRVFWSNAHSSAFLRKRGFLWGKEYGIGHE